MAMFFLNVTLERKIEAVKQDWRSLHSDNSKAGGNAGQDDQAGSSDPIDLLVKKSYGGFTLSSPALLLTVFYAGWILLGDAYLNKNFSSGETWFFPAKLVDRAAPMLYTFIGVYLFNLGSLIRRLYLADLNEQVFWGAINRLWLSLGLGLVVAKTFSEPWLFFSIGFIANIVLEWVLEKSLKLLNVTKPSTEDLPLLMVKGINIWKTYRLEEEGIENVQNLATADVTELAVRTHYNFRTLIDWIDQSLLLVRLTSEQAKALSGQATSISAIELAAASPKATGNNSVANSLSTVLKVDPVLMGATMDRLYEDQCVQDLWNLWQKGKEGGILSASSQEKAAAAAASK
ncbi:MAG: hypothetical protein DMG65_26620 [Candidatus Angelobacter sp. Gp1-AA117]|nr:MAG: hypothetical protein DMG65_26620 [Candidatus Angelobacter sp. Gp1-AA117]